LPQPTSTRIPYTTLFRSNAYMKHKNLTDATRYMVNQLFSNQGLVILDASNKELKHHFIPYMRQELFEATSQKTVEQTISNLNKVDRKSTRLNSSHVKISY